MKARAAAVAVWVAVGLCGAVASANAAEGDAKRGKVLAYTCHGCHGVPDYKNAFPNYSVPKLGGQSALYLINAMNAYASGERSHQTMHSQAATLSDQDRADIAAYLQGEMVKPGTQVIGTPPQSTQVCVACHGSDGAKPQGADYPILAGQYPDYLVHALQEYKTGRRKNPIMAGIVAGLDVKEFEALGEFFGRQQGLCGTDVIREQGKCGRDSE